MSETVTIEVDGKKLVAPKGAMLIKVTDDAGIPIPRFCYHKHLSVAANCRMCLVDVEKAPKPMPACATPVAEGLIVRTRSEKTRKAQQAMMEFLLINHPLDCPVCDQGGECELQDLSLTYGTDESQFIEEKRVIADPDIGPLVATHMTRCIKCTRCVRFGEEIAGLRELGATGRGEDTEIGTYIQKSLASEISANIIDLCPVGALTAKPSEYKARPWEYQQHPGISIHDALGSNLYWHTLRGTITRAVPRENAALNETWIADRDRFSYEALQAEDRVLKPLIRMQNQLVESEWSQAIAATRMSLEGIIQRYGADSVGVMASPLATSEELYLLQKLMRHLGIHNIDHRLEQQDHAADIDDPVCPALGIEVKHVNNVKQFFFVGADIRMEMPVLAIRVRDAVENKGAKVQMLASYQTDQLHAVENFQVLPPKLWVGLLAEITKTVTELTLKTVPESLKALMPNTVSENAKNIANALLKIGKENWLVLGREAIAHPHYAQIRGLLQTLATCLECAFGYVPQGANSVGAHLVGALPHRLAAGHINKKAGLTASQMIQSPLKAYVLFGALDIEDLPAGSLAALRQAEVVIILSPFAQASIKALATVILPLAAWGETAGTLVNAEGHCQVVLPAMLPPLEVKPGWKVLRVLANAFEVEGFGYMTVDEVMSEWQEICHDAMHKATNFTSLTQPLVQSVATAIKSISSYTTIYQQDAYVRRSPALQATPLARQPVLVMSPETAKRLSVTDNAYEHNGQRFAVRVTQKMASDCVRVPRQWLDEAVCQVLTGGDK